MNAIRGLTGEDFERLALNLNPGDWAVESERPISTLLGSCVAVCLYDPVFRLGGMNHFLLPSKRAGNSEDSGALLAGDHAMETLLNAMLAKGARKERLVAKAFGGGNIVSSILTSIGDRNAEFALEWLAGKGIPLCASDFGGEWSRKVICVPQTGEVFCRRSPVNQAADELSRVEAVYEQALIGQRMSGGPAVPAGIG